MTPRVIRQGRPALEDPRVQLQRIEVPTLLLWGEADHMIPQQQRRRLCARTRQRQAISFPDLGHVPQEESPDESVRPLEQFLAQ